MSFRTVLGPAVNLIRSIAGPQYLDVITVQLTIRTRVWAGGRNGGTGPGSHVDTDLVVLQIYDVVHLTERQVASSGGRYEMGDMKIGPITPAFSGFNNLPAGGYTPAQLKPAGADGTEIVYVLTGSVAGEYACIEVHTENPVDDPFSYYLIVRRKRTTP